MTICQGTSLRLCSTRISSQSCINSTSYMACSFAWVLAVKVKWGKETYPEVEANTDEDPLLFKAQLFALTGVQPERQKVMLKGMTLKDDDWGNMKLKDGVTVLLMGSKEEDVPTEPAEKPVFMEDMNESELATALEMPAGLTNLGNTCYMNATVQCLKTVPELREALREFDGRSDESNTRCCLIVTRLGAQKYTLGHLKAPALLPYGLVYTLTFPCFTPGRESYSEEHHTTKSEQFTVKESSRRPPTLASKGVMLSSGSAAPAQSITAAVRDLFEAMERGASIPPIILLQVLHVAFPRFAEKSENGGFQQQDANECWTEMVRMLQQKLPATSPSNSKSLIEQFFGGTLDVQLKCTETEDEPPTNSKESFLQLSCFISQDVRYMASGLRSKMQEQITKMSPMLERDAVYTKTSKISRLPGYLTIQFVRFYYKEKEAINAKILKDVKFPLEFDAFELCSTELQQKLTPLRSRFKELEDKRVEEAQVLLTMKQKGDNVAKKKVKTEPYWFEDDLGSNNSGYYTLQAVLTHRGRSSSSGHYVAWVRQKGDTWLMCDDDQVSPVTSEDVLKLSGGGVTHSDVSEGFPSSRVPCIWMVVGTIYRLCYVCLLLLTVALRA
ncbi:hypothetical protein PR048_020430 [Dryococelus australis]|uniref:Ubiquitin carboxyl-terminal hydrolase n=1 Tax=Dryococelus australis TaxID=614101 RepID=A0ABQ9H6E3_9NEOP|nr:hypothetical protein PR048_020430 [Dryococelus australis]